MSSHPDIPEIVFRERSAQALRKRAPVGLVVYLLLYLGNAAATNIVSEHPRVFYSVLVMLVGIAAVRALVCGLREKFSLEAWEVAFQVTLGIQALLWGSFSFWVLWTYGDRWEGLFILLLTSGIGAGGTSSLAPRLSTLFAFLVLLHAPALVATCVIQSPVLFTVALIYCAFLAMQGRHQYRWFCRALADNLALKNQAVQLAEATEAAKSAAEQKGVFLATMSHEIRTPMNGVIGMTDILLDTNLNDEQREYAQTVKDCGEYLLAVLNDILDFSKLEADKVNLENIEFSLRETVEGVADILAFKAQEKGLQLAVLFQQGMPEKVCSDPGRLRQVLLNLVSNAVKFTSEGEVVIEVKGEQRDGSWWARVEVRDTGAGIPADRLDDLFKMYAQAEKSTTRKFGGTGLGLAICKRLIKAYGGSIGVESELGTGSTFFFEIPLTVARPQPAPLPKLGSLRGLRIVVVDSSKTNRRVFREQLQAWGCEVEGFRSSKRALEAILAKGTGGRPPDMVLLNYKMSGLDGEQLGRRVRQEKAFDETKLVLLTSVPQRGDARRLQECGFDGYLTKPVKQRSLYQALMTIQGRGKQRSDDLPLVTVHALREDSRFRGKILVAEDNATNQRIVAHLLKKEGHDFTLVSNGKEAVEAVGKAKFDLVFMDCQMPVMDGLEASRLIQETYDDPPPIIAVTAGVTEAEVMACKKAGMRDVVAKPLRPKVVRQICETYLPALTEAKAKGQEEQHLRLVESSNVSVLNSAHVDNDKAAS